MAKKNVTGQYAKDEGSESIVLIILLETCSLYLYSQFTNEDYSEKLNVNII